jgi:hypothetical protein
MKSGMALVHQWRFNDYVETGWRRNEMAESASKNGGKKYIHRRGAVTK